MGIALDSPRRHAGKSNRHRTANGYFFFLHALKLYAGSCLHYGTGRDNRSDKPRANAIHSRGNGNIPRYEINGGKRILKDALGFTRVKLVGKVKQFRVRLRDVAGFRVYQLSGRRSRLGIQRRSAVPFIEGGYPIISYHVTNIGGIRGFQPYCRIFIIQ